MTEAKTKKIDNAEEISEELLEKEIEKELIAETREQRIEREREADKEREITSWVPKTKLGKEVKDKKIKNIDEILDSGRKILEEQIVDSLLGVKSDLISIGQSKGKFGGGKRRAWRQTQRKTQEGNIPTFSTLAVVGDENGHIGIGVGKAKETLPARDKAIRQAKRVMAPADSAQNPPTGLSFVMRCPMVLTMRQPPNAVPSAIVR